MKENWKYNERGFYELRRGIFRVCISDDICSIYIDEEFVDRKSDCESFEEAEEFLLDTLYDYYLDLERLMWDIAK